jgi:hypothetical protein
MGIMAGQTSYKGDKGKLRKALREAGQDVMNMDIIYNDKRKTFRRLKMEYASHIFNATQAQQRKLERLLKEAFGERWITAYFIQESQWNWPPGKSTGKSLCIKLKV